MSSSFRFGRYGSSIISSTVSLHCSADNPTVLLNALLRQIIACKRNLTAESVSPFCLRVAMETCALLMHSSSFRGDNAFQYSSTLPFVQSCFKIVKLCSSSTTFANWHCVVACIVVVINNFFTNFAVFPHRIS